MVRRHMIALAMALCASGVMTSCDFFLGTRFPRDISYYDATLNLTSRFNGVYPQAYSVTSLGDVGIFRGFYQPYETNDDVRFFSKVIVFDSKLNILAEGEFDSGTFAFRAANGDIYVGAKRVYTASTNTFAIVDLGVGGIPYTSAIYQCFGCTDGTFDYVIHFTIDRIYIYQFGGTGWPDGGTNTFNGVSFGPTSYGLLNAQAAMNGTQTELALFFTDYSSDLLVSIFPLSEISSFALYSILTETTSWPNLRVFRLKLHDSPRYAGFTSRGIIVRDESDYYSLFSASSGSLIEERQMSGNSREECAESVDSGCSDRYVFDMKTLTMYHSGMWW